MVGIAVSWVCLAGVYLALVGSVSLAEGAAAILSGGLAAFWVGRIGRCGSRTLRLTASALGPLAGAVARLPRESLRVGGRLWRAALHGDAAGEVRTVPAEEAGFRPLADDEPASAGARAVALLAASLAPDAYVLRLEPEHGRVLLHGFLPRDAGAQEMGAQDARRGAG